MSYLIHGFQLIRVVAKSIRFENLLKVANNKSTSQSQSLHNNFMRHSKIKPNTPLMRIWALVHY